MIHRSGITFGGQLQRGDGTVYHSVRSEDSIDHIRADQRRRMIYGGCIDGRNDMGYRDVWNYPSNGAWESCKG